MAVRSFSARGEHRVDGHVNVAAWLQHACHLKKRQALRIARLSRFLDHQPVLEAAHGRRADQPRSPRAVRRPAPRTPRRGLGRGVPAAGGLRDRGPVRGRRPARPNASPMTCRRPMPMTGSPNRSRAAPSPKPPPSTASATSRASWTRSPTPSSPPNTTASSPSSTRTTSPSPARCWAGTPTPSSSPRSPAPPPNAPRTPCGSWPSAPRPSPAAPWPPPPRS